MNPPGGGSGSNRPRRDRRKGDRPRPSFTGRQPPTGRLHSRLPPSLFEPPARVRLKVPLGEKTRFPGRSRTCGPRPTGTSAKLSTCSESVSTAIQPAPPADAPRLGGSSFAERPSRAGHGDAPYTQEDARKHQPLDAGLLAGGVDEEAGEFVLNMGPTIPRPTA